jgi:PAS domain S-box-containing protein
MKVKNVSSKTMRIDVDPTIISNLVDTSRANSDTKKRISDNSLENSSKPDYDSLLKAIYDAVLVTDYQTGRIQEFNERALDFLQYDKSEISDKIVLEIIAGASDDLLENIKDNLDSEKYTLIECFCVRKDLSTFPAEIAVNAISLQSDRFLCFFIRDVTIRKQMEKDLREERAHMNHILGATKTNMNTLDSDYNLLMVDDVWQEIYGDPQGRKCYEYFMNLDKPCEGCGVPEAIKTKEIIVTEEFLPKENRYVEVHTIPFQNEDDEWLVSEFNIDITERKREEAENEKLQLQLIQAQKMESIGRLAGGVAHDFNNMMCVILGYTELALGKTKPSDPIFENLKEVLKAAERSSDLTRQLLTFARKQTILPKVLDLNETVGGMLQMLRGLIGEDIDLVWVPGKDLKPIKMDPSQVDQILVNLCVNARDAITVQASSSEISEQTAEYVGKITIETDVVSFDQAYCKDHPDFLPGDYVLLEVSDNGCGMDSETINYIFEPFSKTKDLRKGIGLELPSVYGAVKQNKGFINVYSELMQGTTFKIYLKQHYNDKISHADEKSAKPNESENEVILLVEDEAGILSMVKIMLERMGYVVIPAPTPDEAIRLASEYKDDIDLLMTDVVMPEMNGRDLAKKLLAINPDIKSLFMSGYTANVIAQQGVLDTGMSFIQKPFSSRELGGKLRRIFENKDVD